MIGNTSWPRTNSYIWGDTQSDSGSSVSASSESTTGTSPSIGSSKQQMETTPKTTRKRIQNKKLVPTNVSQSDTSSDASSSGSGIRSPQSRSDTGIATRKALGAECVVGNAAGLELEQVPLPNGMSNQVEGDNKQVEGDSQPLSIGSELHGSGTCRPCLYVTSAIGCLKGSACQFCHVPHPRKDRLRLTKHRRASMAKQMEQFKRNNDTQGNQEDERVVSIASLQGRSMLSRGSRTQNPNRIA